jgi:hypothetical protein
LRRNVDRDHVLVQVEQLRVLGIDVDADPVVLELAASTAVTMRAVRVQVMPAVVRRRPGEPEPG